MSLDAVAIMAQAIGRLPRRNLPRHSGLGDGRDWHPSLCGAMPVMQVAYGTMLGAVGGASFGKQPAPLAPTVARGVIQRLASGERGASRKCAVHKKAEWHTKQLLCVVEL